MKDKHSAKKDEETREKHKHSANKDDKTTERHYAKMELKMDDKQSRSWSLFRGHTETMAGAPILLVLVCILASSTLGQCRYEPVYVTIDEFNLAERPDIELHDILFRILDSTLTRLAYEGHVYLGDKDAIPHGTPPARWIQVPLRGETDEDRATLPFSDSDLYLRAFQNNQGIWHAFRGYEHMFPGALVLNTPTLDEGYRKLIGGHTNLNKVPLGRKAALQAVRALGRYRQGVTPEPELKTGLLPYMIMISEAFRFSVIREQFSNQWETESYLTETQAKYVVHWGDLSRWVFNWEKEKKWVTANTTLSMKLDELHITNAAQALEILDFLRRPNSLRVDDLKLTP